MSGLVCTLIALFVPFLYLDDMISAGVLVSFNLTNCALLMIRRSDPAQENMTLCGKLIFLYNVLCIGLVFTLFYLIPSHPTSTAFYPLVFCVILPLSMGLLYIMYFLAEQCPENNDPDAASEFRAYFVPYSPMIGKFMFLCVDSVRPVNTPTQYPLNTLLNPPSQCSRPIHPINPPTQHTLSTRTLNPPFNTPSHPILSTHPIPAINSPSQHTSQPTHPRFLAIGILINYMLLAQLSMWGLGLMVCYFALAGSTPTSFFYPQPIFLPPPHFSTPNPFFYPHLYFYPQLILLPRHISFPLFTFSHSFFYPQFTFSIPNGVASL